MKPRLFLASRVVGWSPLLLSGLWFVDTGCSQQAHSNSPRDRAAKKELAEQDDTKPQTTSVQPGGREDALRLKVLSVRDPAVENDEAFRILIPPNWKSEGGVIWRHELSSLVVVAMRVFNPDAPEVLELFPMIPYTWAEQGIPFFGPGSIYLGNELRAPVRGPAEFVQRVFLPSFRRGTDARIVDRVSMPEVAQAVATSSQEAGVQKTVLAERVRLEYTDQGREMQEDVFCVLLYSQSAILPGSTLWGAQRLYSFRTEKGKLDERTPLFQAMANSVRINPVWYGKYLQVVQMWQQGQMQAIRNAGELSRYLARTAEEISEIHRQAWEQQQAASDRVNATFSKYIRGVEAYHNPFEDRRVELPSGYRQAWVSGSGEYFLSNSGTDPNVGSTVTWRRMDVQR